MDSINRRTMLNEVPQSSQPSQTTTTPTSPPGERRLDAMLPSPGPGFGNLVARSRGSRVRLRENDQPEDQSVEKKLKVGEVEGKGAQKPVLEKRSLDVFREVAKKEHVDLRDVENWASYGRDGLQHVLAEIPGVDEMSDPELLKQGRRSIGEAICGHAANTAAKLILGYETGERMNNELNAYHAKGETNDAFVMGNSVDELKSACDAAVEKGERAVALVQLGPSHRFLMEVQPDGKVDIFQGFIGHYSLADWMSARNKKATRSLDDFTNLLGKALDKNDQGRLKSGGELFYLRAKKDPFDFGGESISFALVSPVQGSEKNIREFLKTIPK
jgi:hypothetical protein